MLAIYKTVLIIFPLNLQTITITLDVVKWRGEGAITQKKHTSSKDTNTLVQRGKPTSEIPRLQHTRSCSKHNHRSEYEFHASEKTISTGTAIKLKPSVKVSSGSQ